MLEDNFIPPIRSRTDRELLQMIGAPQKWTPDAIAIASNELQLRKIPAIKLEMATYLESKKDKIEVWKLSKESYHVCDFIFSPIPNLVEILFSWELKKDGYDRKARQQKRFRIFILFVVTILFMYIKLSSYF